MPLFTFVCPAGHTAELLRHRDVVLVACPCGLAGERQAVNRVSLIGQATVPRDERSYRHEFREFAEASAEVGDFYGRKTADGDPVNVPDYYALARAQAIAAGAPIR